MSERIELSPAGMRQKMEDAISRAVCSNIDDSTFRNRWVCNHSLCPLTNADWRSRALTVARSRWLLASSLRPLPSPSAGDRRMPPTQGTQYGGQSSRRQPAPHLNSLGPLLARLLTNRPL